MAEDWVQKFRSHAMRVNFQLALTRAQLEVLCSVAEDVVWDRFTFGGQANPNNPFAASGALERRGLIARKGNRRQWNGQNLYEITSHWELTSAGKLTVELLKVTGLFLQSDHAMERKAASSKGRR